LRIENILYLVKTDRYIDVAAIGMTIMPTWCRISYPSTSMYSYRPNNQKMKISTICRNILYCSNQLYLIPASLYIFNSYLLTRTFSDLRTLSRTFVLFILYIFSVKTIKLISFLFITINQFTILL